MEKYFVWLMKQQQLVISTSKLLSKTLITGPWLGFRWFMYHAWLLYSILCLVSLHLFIFINILNTAAPHHSSQFRYKACIILHHRTPVKGFPSLSFNNFIEIFLVFSLSPRICFHFIFICLSRNSVVSLFLPALVSCLTLIFDDWCLSLVRSGSSVSEGETLELSFLHRRRF